MRAEIAKGHFREDLYHRLAVIIIKVPSLNERAADIPELVKHFIAIVCDEYNTTHKKIEPAAIKLLQKVNWTGNIRELRNVVERLIILSGTTITAKHVETFVHSAAHATSSMQTLFDQFDDFASFSKYLKTEFEKYKGELV